MKFLHVSGGGGGGYAVSTCFIQQTLRSMTRLLASTLPIVALLAGMAVFPLSETDAQLNESEIVSSTLHAESNTIAIYSPIHEVLFELLTLTVEDVISSDGVSTCSSEALSESDCNSDPCEVRGTPGACCMIGGMYFGCDPCGGFMPIEV